MSRLLTRSSQLAVPLLLCCSHALAEDLLKAFQTAVNYMQDDKGCWSIPYSDLQDSCVRKQNEVNKLCKDSGPWNCGDVDPKQLQKQIEELKTTRDTLKAEKEKLESQKSSAADDKAKRELEDKIKEVEQKLYENQKVRDSLQKQVDDASKQVNDRIYIAKGCRDARSDVYGVFKDAKSRAKGESDADIVPLAKRLISWWESREAGHEDAIKNAKTAVETCDRVLYDIGHLGSF